MVKYCPKCGAEMSDNATFCMGCGAKLSDYAFKKGSGISDSIVQRSQVGTARVGTVEIKPTFVQPAARREVTGPVCAVCGRPASVKCRTCETYLCSRHTWKVYYPRAMAGCNIDIGCKECVNANAAGPYSGPSQIVKRGED